MARYRKIDVRIWNDEKFRSLSDHGKLAFFFLLTHPAMTALGAMRGTLPGLAAELGWLSEAFTEAFMEAFRKGMVKHDETASFIGLPNFLKYNPPESPNVVKSWSNALDLIPECQLKVELIERVKAFAKALPEAFDKALPEAFRKSMPNQEQEQEQYLHPIVPQGTLLVSEEIPQNESEEKPGFEYHPQFLRIWDFYPKHTGKGSAFKAWERARKNGMPETDRLLEILEKAKNSKGWKKDNGQFIPMLATWLNGHRWDDDYEPARKERGVVC